MAQRNDGTEVPHSEALKEWAAVAYEELKRVAGTYNKLISYAGLRTVLRQETGLTTGMLMQNWIGGVLEIAAQRAADANEPPLTSLCVRSDGTIGDGYLRAPRAVAPSSTNDVEQLAAEDRLLCYAAFATDMPANGGIPTLPAEVTLQRRTRDGDATSDAWLAELIATGELSTRDQIPFRNHVEVARLFGRDYKGHQSATFRLNESTEVWFPKMYTNGDWSNTLSDDGEVITMQHIQGGKYGGVMQTEPIREYVITFGHTKPAAGPRFYTFLGVFEGAPQLSDRTRWVHQRVADTVYFDGDGDFSFTPDRSRPVQDDQVAEATDPDPHMVVAFQKQLDARSYAVEDKHSTAKSRGSAQAVFAKAVKSNYGWECAVTGIKTRAFLVASHIVPWSEDQEIRLDPSNGICLSTFVDRAFDAGFLGITPEGRTVVRWDKVDGDPILKLELSKIDDVEISKPLIAPPDPAKLARRLELNY